MEDIDVLIVGAGLSGIGQAWHLQRHCPGMSYTIVEARSAIGGTWDLFRYPGIRSDSDMFTLGYHFKPWLGAKSIADGASIKAYIEETACENGIDRHIRFDTRVERLDWSNDTHRWTATVTTQGETRSISAQFVVMASGYYRYDAGFTPDLPGLAAFGGQTIHPQHWPADFAGDAKRIVVIGSGATAMTLVPALAAQGAKVTMLQRSPTYVANVPSADAFADWARAKLPARLAYRLTRAKKVAVNMVMFRIMRARPAKARAWLLKMVREALGPDYDIDRHFTPRYNPWDERLCAVPDGDLFDAIKAGTVEVVTDTIAGVEPEGVRLTSGGLLAADVIVTATGLNLALMGGATLALDGMPIALSDTMIYKGMMLGNVPNLAYIVGYNNASWTLKADLSAQHVCRVLNQMAARRATRVVPMLPDGEPGDGNFFGLQSNYLKRAAHLVPQQGTRKPWRVEHNYAKDFAALKLGRVDDGVLLFSSIVPARTAA